MSNFLKNIFWGACAFSAIKAASIEAQSVVEFDASRARPQKTIAQYVDDYWQDSRLRFLDKKKGDDIKNILLQLPKWPGGEVIKSYEQLFWNNAMSPHFFLFQKLVENPRPLDFKKITDLGERYRALSYIDAAIVCLNLPQAEDQDAFMSWLEHFDINLRDAHFTQVDDLIKVYAKCSDDAYLKSFRAFYDQIHRMPSFQIFDFNEFLSINNIYNSFKNEEERERFMMWIPENPFIKIGSFSDFTHVQEIYCAFGSDEERNLFTIWGNKNPIMNLNFSDDFLLHKDIYCAFKTDDERDDFVTWVNQRSDQDLCINEFYQFNIEEEIFGYKEIYCTFKNQEEREQFIEWGNDFKIFSMCNFDHVLVLIEVYCAFDNDEERTHFLQWSDKITGSNFESSTYFFDLKDLYCAFADNDERERFSAWVARFERYGALESSPLALLQIFREPDIRLKFSQFFSMMCISADVHFFHFALVEAFISQDIIHKMRFTVALMAEPDASYSRIRSIKESYIDAHLPALNPEDPYMNRITLQNGFANAHTLETHYERDAALINTIVESRGYHAALSDEPLTIYNGDEIKEPYQTNVSVMDFIHYLNTEFKEYQHPLNVDGHSISVDRAVGLVKELLGITPRELSTGAFGSYLARPMLYGASTSITGDMLLGQIWHLIKTSLSEQTIEKSLESNEATEALLRESSSRKRSVVLALLSGIDFDHNKADIRCQTRITGELLKMACFYLGNESSLRRFIADGNGAATGGGSQNIAQRIANAPIEAERIFKAVKDSEAFIQLYTESDKPELFELYLCYYDALYQRKTRLCEDGTIRIDRDEHVLERDALGNMVRRYRSDGSPLENPIIVYYQAEFAVLELHFTKLLKNEFHEKRGLIY
ncbi:MAG: hypothetical protein CNLJKLNK_00756 [Holosporales bacterium]